MLVWLGHVVCYADSACACNTKHATGARAARACDVIYVDNVPCVSAAENIACRTNGGAHLRAQPPPVIGSWRAATLRNGTIHLRKRPARRYQFEARKRRQDNDHPKIADTIDTGALRSFTYIQVDMRAQIPNMSYRSHGRASLRGLLLRRSRKVIGTHFGSLN